MMASRLRIRDASKKSEEASKVGKTAPVTTVEGKKE